jgi:hypothetical protein
MKINQKTLRSLLAVLSGTLMLAMTTLVLLSQSDPQALVKEFGAAQTFNPQTDHLYIPGSYSRTVQVGQSATVTINTLSTSVQLPPVEIDAFISLADLNSTSPVSISPSGQFFPTFDAFIGGFRIVHSTVAHSMSFNVTCNKVGTANLIASGYYIAGFNISFSRNNPIFANHGDFIPSINCVAAAPAPTPAPTSPAIRTINPLFPTTTITTPGSSTGLTIVSSGASASTYSNVQNTGHKMKVCDVGNNVMRVAMKVNNPSNFAARILVGYKTSSQSGTQYRKHMFNSQAPIKSQTGGLAPPWGYLEVPANTTNFDYVYDWDAGAQSVTTASLSSSGIGISFPVDRLYVITAAADPKFNAGFSTAYNSLNISSNGEIAISPLQSCSGASGTAPVGGLITQSQPFVFQGQEVFTVDFEKNQTLESVCNASGKVADKWYDNLGIAKFATGNVIAEAKSGSGDGNISICGQNQSGICLQAAFKNKILNCASCTAGVGLNEKTSLYKYMFGACKAPAGAAPPTPPAPLPPSSVKIIANQTGSPQQPVNGFCGIGFNAAFSHSSNRNSEIGFAISLDNGATYQDAVVSAATASSGTLTIDNTRIPYQITGVNTSSGQIIVVDYELDLTAFLKGKSNNQVRIKVLTKDTNGNLSEAETKAFSVDCKNPSAFGPVSVSAITDTTARVGWSTTSTDANFLAYQIAVGTNSADVLSFSGSASIGSLSTAAATSIGIQGLVPATDYVIAVRSVDRFGNATVAGSQTFKTSVAGGGAGGGAGGTGTTPAPVVSFGALNIALGAFIGNWESIAFGVVGNPDNASMIVSQVSPNSFNITVNAKGLPILGDISMNSIVRVNGTTVTVQSVTSPLGTATGKVLPNGQIEFTLTVPGVGAEVYYVVEFSKNGQNVTGSGFSYPAGSTQIKNAADCASSLNTCHHTNITLRLVTPGGATGGTGTGGTAPPIGPVNAPLSCAQPSCAGNSTSVVTTPATFDPVTGAKLTCAVITCQALPGGTGITVAPPINPPGTGGGITGGGTSGGGTSGGGTSGGGTTGGGGGITTSGGGTTGLPGGTGGTGTTSTTPAPVVSFGTLKFALGSFLGNWESVAFGVNGNPDNASMIITQVTPNAFNVSVSAKGLPILGDITMNSQLTILGNTVTVQGVTSPLGTATGKVLSNGKIEFTLSVPGVGAEVYYVVEFSNNGQTVTGSGFSYPAGTTQIKNAADCASSLNVCHHTNISLQLVTTGGQGSAPTTGSGGSGSTGSGSTGSGSTGSGSTGSGSTGSGSTGSGSTGSGSTGSGSTGSGSTGSGSTGSGSTGSGSTGSGATGSGSTGSGSTGSGATGSGATATGSTGAGATGSGATGSGATATGSTGAGTTGTTSARTGGGGGGGGAQSRSTLSNGSTNCFEQACTTSEEKEFVETVSEIGNAFTSNQQQVLRFFDVLDAEGITPEELSVNFTRKIAIYIAIQILKSHGVINDADLQSVLTTGASDVALTDRFGSEIGLAYKLGIVNGFRDGTFGPDIQITLAEAYKILTELMALLDDGVSSRLGQAALDVSPDWFHKYVLALSVYTPTFAQYSELGQPIGGVFYMTLLNEVLNAVGVDKPLTGYESSIGFVN